MRSGAASRACTGPRSFDGSTRADLTGRCPHTEDCFRGRDNVDARERRGRSLFRWSSRCRSAVLPRSRRKQVGRYGLERVQRRSWARAHPRCSCACSCPCGFIEQKHGARPDLFCFCSDLKRASDLGALHRGPRGLG